jgi:hypothetical protein
MMVKKTNEQTGFIGTDTRPQHTKLVEITQDDWGQSLFEVPGRYTEASLVGHGSPKFNSDNQSRKCQ